MQYTLYLLLIFAFSTLGQEQVFKIYQDDDRKIKNRLSLISQEEEAQMAGEEEQQETIYEPEIIPLAAPNSQLIKLKEGEWYLKKIDPKTNQAIMINLNEINEVNFKSKDVEIVEEKVVSEYEQQEFPRFEWTPVIAYDNFPKNRGGHTMHAVGEIIVIWGGCYLDVKCFNDLAMFNVREKRWSYPKYYGDPPSGRSGHASFMNGGKIYIFGGNSLYGLVSDLHVFDLESVLIMR